VECWRITEGPIVPTCSNNRDCSVVPKGVWGNTSCDAKATGPYRNLATRSNFIFGCNLPYLIESHPVPQYPHFGSLNPNGQPSGRNSDNSACQRRSKTDPKRGSRGVSHRTFVQPVVRREWIPQPGCFLTRQGSYSFMLEIHRLKIMEAHAREVLSDAGSPSASLGLAPGISNCARIQASVSRND
jgi:hypothetical protein